MINFKKFILTVLFLTWSTSAFSAIAHVQTTSTTFPQDSGLTQVVSATWTQGNLGVVYSFAYVSAGTPSLSSVEGSSSGTWVVAKVNTVSSNRQLIIYYKENITGGADTVTLTFAGSLSSGSRVVASEYSGVAKSGALDQANGGTGGSNNTITTGARTPTNAGSLMVAICHALTVDQTLDSESHTQRSEAATFGIAGLQDSTSTTGATTMTWTIATGGFWQQAWAIFNPETGGNRLIMVGD